MFNKIYKFYFLIFLVYTNIYSLPCNRVIATVGVGDTPNGIAITPNGKYAYVANNNNDSLPDGDTVSVINLETNSVTTISDASFDEPYTVTINAAGTRAYVTNSNSTTISVINTATNTVIGTITGFDGPSGFAITPDGKYAYVNNYGSGNPEPSGDGTTVRVVDLATNTITGSAITVDQAPAGLAITPDGLYVYVINYVDGNPGTGTVNVISTATNTVIKTIRGFSGPFQIAITPDGKYAYITNFGSNNFSPVGTTVSVIDLYNNSIVSTIKLGTQPAGIAITPNGKLALASNYNTLYLGPGFTNLTPGIGTVNVINVATNQVVCPVVVVGSSPAAIAISPDGKRAYVTNYSSNNVSVIDIQDRMWLSIC